MIICPLCLSKSGFELVQGPDIREYRHCRQCKLIFTSTRFRPTKKEEERRYKQHKNGIQYPGYVKFLNQAVAPALPMLEKGQRGVDYGCGPKPTLSKMMEEHGMICDNYDPLFFPIELTEGYNFIFATECFEHFFLPVKEIQNIYNLLNPGGIFIIMTEHWRSFDQFRNWYYAKERSHVSFYHNATFDYICSKYGFNMLHTDNHRVVILKKEEGLSDEPGPAIKKRETLNPSIF